MPCLNQPETLDAAATADAPAACMFLPPAPAPCRVVCLKERNLLLTQMAWSRRLQDFDTKEMYDKRYKKV